jgi:EthD domain-containing protein
MKLISLISRGSGQDRADFQQWFLREHAPAVLKQIPELAHYVVNVNDVSPKMATAPLDSAPVPYDVVTEMWIEEEGGTETEVELDDALTAPVIQSLNTRGAVGHSYLVTEVVQKDQQTFAPGQRAPGVNLVSAIMWAAGRNNETGPQGWREPRRTTVSPYCISRRCKIWSSGCMTRRKTRR